MKTRRLWLAAIPLTLAAFTAACCSSSFEDRSMLATIDDVTDPESEGWFVIAIDGAAPRRDEARFYTRTPLLRLEPGRHRVTVESRMLERGRQQLNVDVEAGAWYRLRTDSAGRVNLVEVPR